MAKTSAADVIGTSLQAPASRRLLPRIRRLAAAFLAWRRNRMAAAWLEDQPAYLLDDIGIDRSGVARIRRHGLPSEVPSASWPRRRG